MAGNTVQNQAAIRTNSEQHTLSQESPSPQQTLPLNERQLLWRPQI